MSAGCVELGLWAGAFPSELCVTLTCPHSLMGLQSDYLCRHSHHSCWASFSRPQWSFPAHEHTPLRLLFTFKDSVGISPIVGQQ